MQVLLDIKEEKVDFFMTLFHDYKKYVKSKVIKSEKEQILSELKEAVKQVNLAKQGKLKTRSLQEFLDEL